MNADKQVCGRRLADEQADLVVEVFRMLSDSTRIQLLWALADRELSVNELAGRVGKPGPSVSQHLAKLRMARLVRTRREGTQVFYRLENDHVRPARHRRGVQRRARRRRRFRASSRRRRAAGAARGSGLMGIGHRHDHTDSVDNALRDSAAGIRAVKISLVLLGITAAAQLVIVALSGSVALFADTVHNFSDALTAVPLWIAFSMSRRAATRRYTYGFGRVEDLAGLFVVAVIAISAVVAAVEAIRRLIDPVPLTHLSWVAAAGVVGFLGNEVVALYRIRVGNRIGSAALRADGMHARADGLTSLAVVAGAIGAALGFPAADPIVGLLIAGAIAVVLIFAARDVFGRLLDRVDPALVDSAVTVLAARPGVRAVRRVRMRWVGHQLEADAELDVDPSLTLADANTVAHGAEHELAHSVPKLGSVIVHAYPAHDAVFSS